MDPNDVISMPFIYGVFGAHSCAVGGRRGALSIIILIGTVRGLLPEDTGGLTDSRLHTGRAETRAPGRRNDTAEG